MNIQIKTLAGTVRFEGDFSSLAEDVKAAVRSGANLSGADLHCADLSSANLSGADLSSANLSGANLSGVDLSGANLHGEIISKKERPFFSVGPVGSRSDMLLGFSTDKGIRLKTGCFFGSIEEFKARAAGTHGDNIHSQEYAAALAMIETHFNLWP
jgi:hypothetical protein